MTSDPRPTPPSPGAAPPPPERAPGPRLVSWLITLGLVLYVAVALVLVFLASARGRPFGAVLVAVTAILITPLLLSSRKSALERLRAGDRSADGPDGPATGAGG